MATLRRPARVELTFLPSMVMSSTAFAKVPSVVSGTTMLAVDRSSGLTENFTVARWLA